MSGPRRRADPASHIGFLDEAEDEAPKERKKARAPTEDDGLDLDRVW